jgi:2-dehydro-3-deoxyglucarate aldolase/4-hydroxy-2-oxoheptanedioate aldolase
MQPSFRSRLHNHEPLLGTLITLPSPEVAEIFGEAGLDWLFVDLEHSTLEPRDAQRILQAVAGRTDCILRVPLNDEIWIKKALDTGAAGVMVPQVNTCEDAQRAVRCSKYPPQGTRSVGMARAHGYGATFQEYIERANADTAVVIQIEHIRAVENIETILEAEGIDAILVGPYDLSASMNLIGQVDHAQVQSALACVRQACLAREMPFGIFTASPEKAQQYLAQGYTLVAVGSDTSMLAQAVKSTVKSLHP